jgi:hypothetical protein
VGADSRAGLAPIGVPTVLRGFATIDLRSAVYLAGRLLATLYDITMDQVTP